MLLCPLLCAGLPLSISAIVFLFVIVAGLPLAAQDDITTQKRDVRVQWLIHHRPGLESVELPERRCLAYYRQPGTL